jgi:hypothetical protein
MIRNDHSTDRLICGDVVSITHLPILALQVSMGRVHSLTTFSVFQVWVALADEKKYLSVRCVKDVQIEFFGSINF